VPAFDPSRRRDQFLPAKVQSQCSDTFRDSIDNTMTATKVEPVAVEKITIPDFTNAARGRAQNLTCHCSAFGTKIPIARIDKKR
jgi:uncharacterized membrane-anchored protein